MTFIIFLKEILNIVKIWPQPSGALKTKTIFSTFWIVQTGLKFLVTINSISIFHLKITRYYKDESFIYSV